MTLMFWIASIAVWFTLSMVAAVVLGRIVQRRDHAQASELGALRRLADSERLVHSGARRRRNVA